MLWFTPTDFLDPLERERRWCELLLTAMSIRAERRTMEALSLADALVLQTLERRVQALRN
jgi:hypothetical protein